VGGFFGELTKELAKRWMSLLAVPGVLFLATTWVAVSLGHAYALDLRRLTEASSRTARQVAAWPGAVQALAVVGVALGTALVGLVVRALVGPVRAGCLGQWPFGLRWFGAVLAARRRGRWHRLLAQRREAENEQTEPISPVEQQRIDRIAGRMNALALAEPDRPTWMGDRIHAAAAVARNRYGLDLVFCWPRLWLVLPDVSRSEINAAQRGFAAAMVTTTWSVPYLVLGAVWWPAALVAVVIALAGRHQGREQLSLLTELVEATLDLHGRTLAVALGVGDPAAGPIDPEEGRQVSDIARKGR
jgi:hypothetical protein